jgi:hypothetical protein
MLCGKVQEMLSRLCIRTVAGKLPAALDQRQQPILSVLRGCHDAASWFSASEPANGRLSE